METLEFTRGQAAYIEDLVLNKIQPAFGYLERVSRGETPRPEGVGLSLAALSSLTAQIRAIGRQPGVDAMEETAAMAFNRAYNEAMGGKHAG